MNAIESNKVIIELFKDYMETFDLENNEGVKINFKTKGVIKSMHNDKHVIHKDLDVSIIVIKDEVLPYRVLFLADTKIIKHIYGKTNIIDNALTFEINKSMKLIGYDNAFEDAIKIDEIFINPNSSSINIQSVDIIKSDDGFLTDYQLYERYII